MNALKLAPLLLFIAALAGCGQDATQPEAPAADLEAEAAPPAPEIASNPNRNAYFGDLHVHTRYSFDAFIFGTRATPDDAYGFAKGGGLRHVSGLEMKMNKPLDFQAVTDHATYLGMLPAMFDAASAVGGHPLSVALREASSGEISSSVVESLSPPNDGVLDRQLSAPPGLAGGEAVLAAFNAFLPRIGGRLAEPDDLLNLDIVRDAWHDIMAAAQRHNDPGNFTTFIGYEFTSSGPQFENLHRNVIFRDAGPQMPHSVLDSANPEDLWTWLDGLRAQGVEGLAIPHNSNGSSGWMFDSTYHQSDKPMDAPYAEQRMRNEPLVEVTQVKGTSDTHPLLSPNDEWADFEIMPVRVGSTLPSQPQGSYVREALRNGLAMEEADGFNPYRFGLIGSSDTHNAAGSFEEDNYWSKVAMVDATPQLRGSVPMSEPTQDGGPYFDSVAATWGASGLAAVWAESNTREAIYDAFRRKEAFATSGPHIRVRFFAGYGLQEALAEAPDRIAAAYEAGVPMGGDLMADGESSPGFFVWAMRDADAAPLQRAQIIKGWVQDDETFDQVFDVACADGGEVDAETHRCPDNGAAVDLATCDVSQDKGAAELTAFWRDPTFTPGQRAFYYVRVLENPKCRWSTWDAVRAGTPPNPDMHATIQDRAWSSPIWYRP